MALYQKLDGTTQVDFALGGPDGPSVQNDQLAPSVVGAVAAIDNLGRRANIRAADPQRDEDVVTLGYLKSLSSGACDECAGLFGCGEGLFSGKTGGLYGSR